MPNGGDTVWVVVEVSAWKRYSIHATEQGAVEQCQKLQLSYPWLSFTIERETIQR